MFNEMYGSVKDHEGNINALEFVEAIERYKNTHNNKFPLLFDTMFQFEIQDDYAEPHLQYTYSPKKKDSILALMRQASHRLIRLEIGDDDDIELSTFQKDLIDSTKQDQATYIICTFKSGFTNENAEGHYDKCVKLLDSLLHGDPENMNLIIPTPDNERALDIEIPRNLMIQPTGGRVDASDP